MSANPYYSPERYGAEVVATLDADLSYEFSTALVLRKLDDGKLYGAHDAGCSCPTPFEDITFPDDFEPIQNMDDLDSLIADVGEVDASDVADFKAAVRKALDPR